MKTANRVTIFETNKGIITALIQRRDVKTQTSLVQERISQVVRL